ncbi:LysR family transcriptional regulator [Sphingomonas sp. HF-S4]|uniref:LysR family transcriptional regulator n=1 Tax=Sphingomonas agrestis TaxID=3080540 RepID=A0ABU3Y937_9SPHN|nr:LysR family transcriptional regulator [Sphingomonas sp. HF-S4]MDV3457938.1 LysR family transcriptional regulator [Sphingomonas sp. HF-S4]
MLFDGRIISGITVFVAVARAGSYLRAADQLGLSRSGVGKAISRLEERTGMRLFDRNARALKLTDQGRTFLEEATPLLESLGRIATPSTPASIKGRLRVSADGAFGPYLVIPMLPEFLEQHPQVKVDVVVRDRVDNLLLEGFDVAVRFGEPDPREVSKHLLCQSRVITCASQAYLEQMGAPTSPDDFVQHHRCIRMIDDTTGKPHPWNFLNAAGQHRTIIPDCGLTLNDAPSLVAAALSDYGIVRLLDVVAADLLRSGRLVEVLPDWNHRRWPGYLFTRADLQPSLAVEAFKKFTIARLSQQGAS